MNGPQALHDSIGGFGTRMGQAFVGTRAVFRGHDLHAELKHMDWVELYVFGITGRRFTPAQLRMMHALWVCTSYPDPRIWNNRVAALAGSARSTGNLGMAAALAVSEASIYGRGIDVRAIEFLARTQAAVQRGQALADCVHAELKAQRGIAGYGRPIANGDERIAPLMSLARELGLADGPHVTLAFEVERVLLDGRWRWRMNYGALSAAMAADLGLSTREYYLFSGPAFLAGMQPCFIEASERVEGTLFPLACAHVRYEGPAARAWPGRVGDNPTPVHRAPAENEAGTP
jgi:hypothetical protein